ncbi:MAG: DinB family protein [Dehalococcoidia bacterium]
MDTATRLRLINDYANGHQLILDALRGATEADLDRVPADGSWTARMIVHHLADSEMTSCLRVRRLIAEDNPQIVGYPEEVWAQQVFYDRPIEPSLEAMRAARASTVPILLRMSDAQWQRPGQHNELGNYTPEVWLGVYVRHAQEHAAQITRATGR